MSGRRPGFVGVFAVRSALFAALWWMVIEAAAGAPDAHAWDPDAWDPDAWGALIWGVVAAVSAAAVSMALLPPTRLAWTELLRFIPFFLAHSLLGGLGVARAALHPRLPIAPALVTFPLRLPPGLPRVVLANTLALLPGTLSVDIAADSLQVHVLDTRTYSPADFLALEGRVARLFAIPLSDATGAA